jgi:hypothetical protein
MPARRACCCCFFLSKLPVRDTNSGAVLNGFVIGRSAPMVRAIVSRKISISFLPRDGWRQDSRISALSARNRQRRNSQTPDTVQLRWDCEHPLERVQAIARAEKPPEGTGAIPPSRTCISYGGMPCPSRTCGLRAIRSVCHDTAESRLTVRSAEGNLGPVDMFVDKGAKGKSL